MRFREGDRVTVAADVDVTHYAKGPDATFRAGERLTVDATREGGYRAANDVRDDAARVRRSDGLSRWIPARLLEPIR